MGDALQLAIAWLDADRIRAALAGGATPQLPHLKTTMNVMVSDPGDARCVAALDLLMQRLPKPLSAAAAGELLILAVRMQRRGGVVRLLLDAGASAAHVMSPAGDTALHQVPRREVVHMLVAAGASVAAVDCDGQQPLHRAVVGFPVPASLEATAALLEAGADPSFADHGGVTPMMLTAERSGLHAARLMARMLLAAGADPTREDHTGRRALSGALHAIASRARRNLASSAWHREQLRNSMRMARLLLRAEAWWRRRHALLAIHDRRGAGMVVVTAPVDAVAATLAALP